MNDNVLIKKLRALITIRVIFLTVLLGSFFIFQVGYRGLPHPRAALNLIIALYLLTIVYALLLNRVKLYVAFAYVQLFIDAFATNMLIVFTGGIESWFSFIMPLTVLSASVVLNKRAGYVIATFNSVSYGTIIDFQYYGFLPIGYDMMLKERDFLYNSVAHITAFYLVAFLSGYLSSRLEKTAKALEQTDFNLKELAFFNEELIENIPSGIFTTDIDGKVLVFNKAAEGITGIAREMILDKNVGVVFPFLTLMSDIERLEHMVRHPEGGDRIIGLNISSLRDTAGEKIGFIGIFQDLTQLKRMEAEIKQKEKWAAIGELSANIAHEIRNPLASLKGSMEILKEDRVKGAQRERLTEIALKEMERLDKIITDFLMYSRPRPARFGVFDLNAVLDNALELLRNTGRVVENISIRRSFNGVLMVNADQQKLQQVFWNLGMNAIEAMPDGGELFVSTKKADGFIEIIFKDTGVGISPENMEKIFYPFFTTKHEGTGLGLAIAYRVIEEHRGKINIISNSGKGTTLRILIPDGDGKS